MINKFNFNGFLKPLLAILISVIIVLSCKNEQRELETNSLPHLNDLVNKNIGKRFIISDSLTIYSPFTNYLLDSAKVANSKFKIYSHINVSCPTCIEEIKLWNNLALEFSKYDTPVILIFGTKDDFEFIKYLCESGGIKNFPYPFFMDNIGEYNTLNEFMRESSDSETILTNQENIISLIGNPLHSKEVKDLYIKEIQQTKNEIESLKKQPKIHEGFLIK